MRKLFAFLLVALAFGAGNAHAQTTCGPDTLRPGILKATGNVTIQASTAAGVNGAGQWYTAPGPLTITGVQFLAFSPAATNASNTPVEMQVDIIEFDLSTQLPIGPVLATATTTVDTVFAGGASPTIIKHVTFANPLVFTEAAYIVSVKPINTPTPVIIIANNPFAGDGQGKAYGYLNYNGTWVKGTTAGIGGGATFDADWLIAPIVTYTLNPVLTIDNTICLGDPTDYSLAYEGFSADSLYNLKWFFEQTGDPSGYMYWGNGAMAHPGDPFTYSTPGIYNVEFLDTIYTYHGEMCMVSLLESVSVNALPTVTISQAGSDLTANQTTGLDWLMDGTTTGLTAATITPTVSGLYSVVFTDGNGCTDTSNAISVTVTGLADNLFATGLQLYPNPATGSFQLRGVQGTAHISITSLAGQVIARHTVEMGNTPSTVDVTSLTPGLYFIQVEMNGQTGTQKLVVY